MSGLYNYVNTVDTEDRPWQFGQDRWDGAQYGESFSGGARRFGRG